MPYTSEWKRPGLETRFSGPFTGEVMRDCIEAVTQHPNFEDHRYHICDFRDVTSLDVSDQAIVDSCALLIGSSYTNANVLVTAVATQDFMKAFLDRFVALGVSPFPIKRFATPDEAQTWVFATLARARPKASLVGADARDARFRSTRK